MFVAGGDIPRADPVILPTPPRRPLPLPLLAAPLPRPGQQEPLRQPGRALTQDPALLPRQPLAVPLQRRPALLLPRGEGGGQQAGQPHPLRLHLGPQLRPAHTG